MELQQIKYFLAAARYLNFSRTAESIPITLPTLSQQLRKLEEELGTPLFERSPKYVRLTPAGLAFKPQAEAALESIRRAKESVRPFVFKENLVLNIGIISVACIMGLWEKLTKFQKDNPGLKLNMVEGGSADLWRLLENQKLDLAVLVPWPGAYAELQEPGEEPPSQAALRGLILARDQIVLIMPGGHPLAKEKKLNLSMLKDQPLIMTDPQHNVIQQYFLEACLRQGFSPQVNLRTQFATTYIEAASQNLGLAVVSEQVARSITKKGLTARRFNPPLTRPLALVYPSTFPHLGVVAAIYQAFRQ